MVNDSEEELVTLFVVSDCPLCETARRWLKQHKVDYVELNVENFGALRKMYELTGQRLVPVFEAKGQVLVRPADEELAELLL